MQNYFGTEPELDIAKTIRRGLLEAGADSGAPPVQPQMPQEKPSQLDNLLNMAKPMTPKEQSVAEHGDFGHMMRSIGGYFLGDHEMFTKPQEVKDQYETDKARYDALQQMKGNMPAFREYDSQLRDSDPNNDSEALYMMNKMFGADDNLMKQMYGEHGARSVGPADRTELDNTLKRAGISRADFEALPTETRRAVLYQHGSDEDRQAMDRVAGQQTLEEIEAEAAARGHGEASGARTAEAIGFLPNATQIAADQEYAIAGTQGIIDMIKDGDINTGMIPNMIKETFNVQTKADGTLGYQATQALIAQINSATFGALSEREIETLEKMFANGSYNEEQNLGVLEGVMGKLNHEKEKHVRRTDESLRRVKKFAPEEYDFFMQDDDNWLAYGDASKLPRSEGGKSFSDVWPMMQEDGLSREEAVVSWRDELKKEREASAEAAKRAEDSKKLAEEAVKEMTNWASSFAGDNR